MSVMNEVKAKAERLEPRCIGSNCMKSYWLKLHSIVHYQVANCNLIMYNLQQQQHRRGGQFGIQLLDFRFRGSGFRFRDSVFGFRLLGFGLRISGFDFWVLTLGFWISGFGVRVSGFDFWVSGFGGDHCKLRLQLLVLHLQLCLRVFERRQEPRLAFVERGLQLCPRLLDRSVELYVAFFERGLELLHPSVDLV